MKVHRKRTPNKVVSEKRKAYQKVAAADAPRRLIGGSRKGIPNRVTTEAKTAIGLAFEGIGGVPALIAWASKNDFNRGVFYSRIYTRLIPVQIAGQIDGNVRVEDLTAKTVLERVLTGLVQQRIDSDAAVIIEHQRDEAEPVAGDAGDGAAVAGEDDADRDRGAVPQLVVSRSR
jgi:hypothetical protein